MLLLVLIVMHLFELSIELVNFNFIRDDLGLEIKLLVLHSVKHPEVVNEVGDLLADLSELKLLAELFDLLDYLWRNHVAIELKSGDVGIAVHNLDQLAGRHVC